MRNRLRRRLRVIVRENRAHLRPGHGYLVRPTAAAALATHEELARALREALGACRDGASV
jgi:ribonuclease P protein component